MNDARKTTKNTSGTKKSFSPHILGRQSLPGDRGEGVLIGRCCQADGSGKFPRGSGLLLGTPGRTAGGGQSGQAGEPEGEVIQPLIFIFSPCSRLFLRVFVFAPFVDIWSNRTNRAVMSPGVWILCLSPPLLSCSITQLPQRVITRVQRAEPHFAAPGPARRGELVVHNV